MGKGIKVPHTLVLLFGIMIVALAATWVLPQGSFQQAPNEAGRMMVVPGTYAVHEERVWLSPTALFTAVPRALADAQAIIFFLLIVGGAIAVLRATGMIDAVLGWLLKRIGHSPALLILFGTTAFAAGSATLGVSTEYIPFALVLIALCTAMRLDAMTAMGVMICGYGVGYGVAWMNPYTVLVAQQVAELQPVSGLWYRLLIFVPFVGLAVLHTWRYARRVQADPSASLTADLDDPRHQAAAEYPSLSLRHGLVLALVLVGLVAMVYGIQQRQWYLTELGGIWLAVTLLAGLVGGLKTDELARTFATGASQLAVVALLVGFARSIGLILEDGQVLHTIVHGASVPLDKVGSELSAVGMLVMQTLMNFFVPSGSGQAYATMPIMVPLSDVIGIERQVAVLAFQFGDGFSNMILPTNIVLMAILGVAGIPFDRWVRFIWPLMLQLMALAAVALVVAVWIGYS
ncbi:MAG: YfcC family protein [Lysobacteraceae bacterium]